MSEGEIELKDKPSAEEQRKAMIKKQKEENAKTSAHLDKILFSVWETYFAIIPSLVVGSGTTILFYLFGRVIKELALYEQTLKTGVKINFMPNIEKIAWGMLGYSIAIGISRFLDVYMWFRVGSKVSGKLRKDIFKCLMESDITFYDKNSVGSIITLLMQDTEIIQNNFCSVKGVEFQNFSMFAIGVILSFIANWKLALIMLCELPLTAIVSSIFIKFIGAAFVKVAMNESKMVTVAKETFSSIKTVKSFNAEEYERDQFVEHGLNSVREEKKSWYWSSASCVATIFISYGTLILLLYLGAYWIDKDKEGCGYTVGELVSFFGYCAFSTGGLFMMLTFHQGEAAAIASAGRIITMTSQVSEINFDGGYEPETFSGKIEFKNVSFKYPSRDQLVLKNVSLKVEPNQFSALVGESGSGKSTCVQLLERYYDVTEGEILIDDKNIKEYNPRWLHRHIGLVSQDPSLFRMSIKNNIKYGAKNATDEDVIKAAEIANAKEFIEAFEKKYDTIVGEKGSLLSGGQKQRIAIARAVIRNPTILITDEATSALDASNEKIVQEALDKIMVNRTSVVVAHRLSTIKNADVIYVFNQGEVVEHGTHESLIEKKGAYFNLVSKQLSIKNGDESNDSSDDFSESSKSSKSSKESSKSSKSSKKSSESSESSEKSK